MWSILNFLSGDGNITFSRQDFMKLIFVTIVVSYVLTIIAPLMTVILIVITGAILGYIPIKNIIKGK